MEQKKTVKKYSFVYRTMRTFTGMIGGSTTKQIINNTFDGKKITDGFEKEFSISNIIFFGIASITIESIKEICASTKQKK